MDFDDGRFDGRYGIRQCDGSVRICARVENDAIIGEACPVQFINQFALVVALEIVHGDGGEFRLQQFEIFFESLPAIYFRFALAEQVEVRAVEYQ